jgi:hypothetical protein
VTTGEAGRNADPGDRSDTAAPHPEEMRVAVDLTIGKSVSVRATARATPAGLATAALLVAAILVPMVWLARARARERVRPG